MVIIMTTIFGNKKGLAVGDNSSSVLVDPVGGLEIDSKGLKIKRDEGIQTTADGTSVIDRVEKAGDIMTGDLFLSNDASAASI